MLKQIEFNRVYESAFNVDETLLNQFYRPLLDNVVRYDRIAGYLSLRSLAHALEGIDSLLESDGKVRIVAGSELYESERNILFPDADDPHPPRVKSQLAIIATMLERGDLEIKIATPTQGDGIFHPKLGIGVDKEGNTVTFEGSVNETVSAWKQNFERFKTHRSWVDGEAQYVAEDKQTFNALWEDMHNTVDVYPLPEAERQNLIDWTDYGGTVEDHVEHVRNTPPTTGVGESVVRDAVSCAGQTPGGIHLSEDIATINPWPHQRTISDTAYSIYPENLLFCDEVGLGKTIEAGLTVSRLLHTGKADTALFLTPAGLVEQWQEELLSLFNIHAYRVDNRRDGIYLVGPSITNHEINVSEMADEGTDSVWGESVFGNIMQQSGAPQVVIESWHRARRDSNVGDVAPDTSANVWDVTVVDEAHSASANGPNDTTKLYDLLGEVESVSECMYALTATPMELAVGDLHDLLRLCDLPESWNTKEAFEEFFETQQTLRSILSRTNFDNYKKTKNQRHTDVITRFRDELGLEDNEARQRISEFAEMVMDHFQQRNGYHGRAERFIQDIEFDSITQRKSLKKLLGIRDTRRSDRPRDLMFDCDIEHWNALVTATDWGSPVKSRIFRNNRSILEKCEELGLDIGNIPDRDVETKQIKLEGEIKDIYDDIERYIKQTYKESQDVLKGKEKHALGFVMTLYQRRLTSSISAIQQSLQRRRETVSEKQTEFEDELSQLSEEGNVTEATINEVVGEENVDSYTPSGGEALNIIQKEQERLDEFVDNLQKLTSDPKLTQLKEDIRMFERKGKDKMIIFTQYHDTLCYIQDTLSQTHNEVGTYSGNGGKRYDAETDSWVEVGKEVITQQFKDGDIRFLICTDSASEGLNLQTADVLINYDLPWNPMRVEQRIGRIDRIGQQNDVVNIINYGYEDSVDVNIYEQLEERLDLFEDIVGEMRPVLSSLETDIRSAAMEGDEGSDSVDDVVETATEKSDQAQEKIESTGLGTQDTIETREEIINEAGVNGWDACHTALTEIGKRDTDVGYEPLISPTTIERLITESDSLTQSEWDIFSIRNHKEIEEYADVSESVYVLQPPETYEGPPLTGDIADESAQNILNSEGAVAVTFSPRVAREYTSLRLLLPGDPLYAYLLDQITAQESRLKIICGSRTDGSITVDVVDSLHDTPECDVLLPVVADESLTFGDELEIPQTESAKQRVEEFLRLAV